MSSIFSSKNKSNNSTPRKNSDAKSKTPSPRVDNIKSEPNANKESPRLDDLKSSKSSKGSPRKNSLKRSTPEIKISQHLIYDRIPINRFILKEYIQSFGGVVTEVDNSNDVIDNVKSHGEYNIIWMDIPMPEMNSLECISYLRNELKYNGPIIGLIGYTDDHTREICYNADINHLITKPFDLTAINAYIEKYS
ncbi:putative sensor histidine kinase [Klosneuvirus KNV1]|uniref:Putative sensor histidine kinase n=1 Tax=Klosneuvirus KNV1 TaxID=1977640 RepID=A0A1V0SKI5_9VIRU|nr:putative sensor histidine kinase [Klosneuvirus KNV1]